MALDCADHGIEAGKGKQRGELCHLGTLLSKSQRTLNCNHPLVSTFPCKETHTQCLSCQFNNDQAPLEWGRLYLWKRWASP